MDILILMPIDEQHAISSLALMNAIAPEKRKYVFPMAAYADYLVQNKLAKNWEDAALKAIVTSVVEYKQDNEHNVFIGNTVDDSIFDLIVSFDDTGEFIPYDDKFLTLLKNKEGVEKDNPIKKMLDKLYDEKAAKMIMIDTKATGEFISKYLDTEVKIDEHLGEQLKSQIKFWQVR